MSFVTSGPVTPFQNNGAQPIKTPGSTVALLPNSATWIGAYAYVTDATLTPITGLGLAPIGGGGNLCPVFCIAAGSWIIL